MNFSTGLSAIQTNQFAIDNIAHNLANANTEGYHRQGVNLKTKQPELIGRQFVGRGVEIGGIDRSRDQIVESELTNSISDLKAIEGRLDIETRIESLLLPGEGSIQNALTGLFDELGRLSANPGESTQRRSVVQQSVNLASRIQTLAGNLVEIRESVGQQIDVEVQSLNQDIERLVDLQNRIRREKGNGEPHDLLDQRDQLINKLAEQIDIQRYESNQGGLGLSIAGSSISIGVVPIRFESYIDDAGNKLVRVEGADRPTTFAGGKISTLVEAHATTLPDQIQQIDDLATSLISQFNQAHAVGVGVDGSFDFLKSSLVVPATDTPLADLELPFPVEEGQLSITVTSPTGKQRTESIDIDPATDSLEDIAAKISTIDNIQAVVDSQTGRLTIVAGTGYQFDFTGSLETGPNLDNFTGSSEPSFGGVYTGDANQQYTLNIVGSGTVGKSDDLKAQIISDGTVLKEINLGEGYEAGKPIDIGQGVTVSFSAGDIVDGDALDLNLTANPDTTGILAALGINHFFDGTDASDIRVAQRIVDDPDTIASSRTGEISDTRNLQTLTAIRSQRVQADSSVPFEEYFSEAAAEIGFQVQSSTILQTSFSDLNFEYQTRRDSVSGVDVNEELVKLTQHQKSYEAGLQIIRTMESMLDELFQLIR